MLEGETNKSKRHGGEKGKKIYRKHKGDFFFTVILNTSQKTNQNK